MLVREMKNNSAASEVVVSSRVPRRNGGIWAIKGMNVAPFLLVLSVSCCKCSLEVAVEMREVFVGMGRIFPMVDRG